MYVKELKVRYQLRRVRGVTSVETRIQTPSDAARLLVPVLRHEIVEVCGLVCLNTRCDLLVYHELSRGTLDSTVVRARDVFRIALLANAASLVIAHNHPSGDVSPSGDDVALTGRLIAAGTVMGVEVADHVIVGADGRYFSFRESGRLL